MINPCDGCPKRVEYDEYDKCLGRVILTKPRPNEPEITDRVFNPKLKVDPPKKKTAKKPGRPKKKPGPGLTTAQFFQEQSQCAMGGCDRFVKANGYCHACNAVVYYNTKKGLPIPTELSDRQRRRRGMEPR